MLHLVHFDGLDMKGTPPPPPGRYDVQKLELAAHVAAPWMLDWRTKACEQSLVRLNHLSAVHIVAKIRMFAKKPAIANLQYGIHNVCYYK